LKVQRSANLQDREWPVPAAAVIGPGSPIGCTQSVAVTGPGPRKRGPAALVRCDAMALVYSTDHGRSCPGCSRSLAACICKADKPIPAGDGIVRVSREKQGRGGKTVTVVRGLVLDATALTTTGKQLRAAGAAGGTAKDGVIEVQGDHVERVMTWLTQAGYRVKRAGG
jgi:translation initiation factor 1